MSRPPETAGHNKRPRGRGNTVGFNLRVDIVAMVLKKPYVDHYWWKRKKGNVSCPAFEFIYTLF